MSTWLREDTAVTIVIGPFVDPTTPATEEEALSLTQATIRLSKNGGAFAQKNDTATATHMENGFYSCALNATDTNTAGTLVVAVDDASALIWWKVYHVVPIQVWDSFLGTDRLEVHAAEISANLITATAIQDNAITANKINADAITEAKIANGAINAATFAAGAIDAAAIATDAIQAAKIQSGAITNAKFAAGAIDAAAIATDAVNEIQTDLLKFSTALPGTPTADTVGNALKNASIGIPASAPGASGGLPLYDDLFSVVAEGTLATVTNAGQMKTLGASFNDTDDFYNGMFLVPQDGPAAHQPRAISDYVGSSKTCTFTGTGSQLTRPFSVAPEKGDSVKILGLAGTF